MSGMKDGPPELSSYKKMTASIGNGQVGGTVNYDDAKAEMLKMLK